MKVEQVESFIEGLIENTKSGCLDWQPFSYLGGKNEILRELEDGRGGFDYGVNSIRETQSYFLKSEEGYVFLFQIYHGDPEITSPSFDTIGLMVKINKMFPLENLSSFQEEEQEILERLKLLIEHFIESKYDYPDVLYDFFEQVLNCSKDK